MTFQELNENFDYETFQFLLENISNWDQSPKLKEYLVMGNPINLKQLCDIRALWWPELLDKMGEYTMNKKQGNNPFFKTIFEDIFKDTHGVLIYDEQVDQLIVRALGCSDMDARELKRNAVLNFDCTELVKAIKASKCNDMDLILKEFFNPKLAFQFVRNRYFSEFKILSFYLVALSNMKGGLIKKFKVDVEVEYWKH